MVKALFGKCNGAEVIFTQSGRGAWTTAVPASEDKTYIIEVWAEDEAGNIGYFATIETIFNPQTLRMEFRVLDVGAGFSTTEVKLAFSGKEIYYGK